MTETTPTSALAVVTETSPGIGTAFAQCPAANGFDLAAFQGHGPEPASRYRRTGS